MRFMRFAVSQPDNHKACGVQPLLSIPTKLVRKVSNRVLRNSKREDKLRPNHQKLRSQTLEERPQPLIAHKLEDNTDPGLGRMKGPVLHPGFDDIQGLRHSDRSGRTDTRSDRVLCPSGGLAFGGDAHHGLGSGVASEQLEHKKQTKKGSELLAQDIPYTVCIFNTNITKDDKQRLIKK